MKLLTNTPYVDGSGKLTQAGWQALQGQFDEQAAADTALETRVTAVETAVAGSFIRLQTAVASTSGTAINFTGIPSWVRRVTVMLANLSTNGTSQPILRVGDGAIVSSGYLGSATSMPSGVAPSSTAFTTACGLTSAWAASSVLRAVITISKLTGNTWVFSGAGGFSDVAATTVAGSEVTLSGILDRVQITTVGGANTFDLGTVNISWE